MSAFPPKGKLLGLLNCAGLPNPASSDRSSAADTASMCRHPTLTRGMIIPMSTDDAPATFAVSTQYSNPRPGATMSWLSYSFRVDLVVVGCGRDH
ncbi:MAG TPA: hypothetical protein VMI75_21685 [Polyangiaceae bacterium]|nr:hypothetical protein [Polyangiaceae bacterium]